MIFENGDKKTSKIYLHNAKNGSIFVPNNTIIEGYSYWIGEFIIAHSNLSQIQIFVYNFRNNLIYDYIGLLFNKLIISWLLVDIIKFFLF